MGLVRLMGSCHARAQRQRQLCGCPYVARDARGCPGGGGEAEQGMQCCSHELVHAYFQQPALPLDAPTSGRAARRRTCDWESPEMNSVRPRKEVHRSQGVNSRKLANPRSMYIFSRSHTLHAQRPW